MTNPPSPPPSPVSPGRLGNVFWSGEPIELPVLASARGRSWRLLDAWGEAAGDGRVPDGGDLRLGPLDPGHYALMLEGRDEPAALLAVLSPFETASVDDSPFGVMTHFAAAWRPDLVEPLARAGIKHVRDEVFWNSVEKQRGVFTFPEKFERYMAEVRDHGMTQLAPLTFGNPLYDPVEGVPTWASAPYTDEGMAGYARYAAAVVRHYRHIRCVEVWNEYNGGFAKGPADGRPEVYAAMLDKAHEAIKRERPDVQIAGCATVNIPLGWIEEVFRRGGLDHMDAVSVHPYGYHWPPEGLVPRIEGLRNLIRRYNKGRDKPIWVTEQGWFLMPQGSRGNREPITEFTKAAYLVRAWTLFLAHGVEKAFWYLARNDEAFGTMGLLGKPDDARGRYAPLPALVAYGILIRQLTGAVYRGAHNAPAPIHAHRFARDRQFVHVLWATEPTQVVLQCDAPKLTAIDLMGRETSLNAVGGGAALTLGPAPLYVHGHISDVSVTKFDTAFTSAPRTLPPRRPEPRVRIDPFPRLGALDRLSVLVRVRPDEAAATIRRVEWRVGDATGERDDHISLAPGPAHRIDLPVTDLEPMRIYDAKVTVTLDNAEQLTTSGPVSFNPIVRRTISPDAGAAAWDGAAAIDLSLAAYRRLLADHGGDDDLSGHVKLAWDDHHLYFTADIVDDVFDQKHTGDGMWKGDNIQLGFSTLPPWAGGEWEAGWQEWNIGLTPDGPQVYRAGGPTVGPIVDARLAVRRTGEVTHYDLAIPWSHLTADGQPPRLLSFGLFVNDADGAGRRGYKQWADIKRLDRMQPLILRRP